MKQLAFPRAALPFNFSMLSFAEAKLWKMR
jgi:hypothetical protein